MLACERRNEGVKRGEEVEKKKGLEILSAYGRRGEGAMRVGEK